MHIKCSNKHIYHDLEIQLSTFLSFKSSEQKYKETKKCFLISEHENAILCVWYGLF